MTNVPGPFTLSVVCMTPDALPSIAPEWLQEVALAAWMSGMAGRWRITACRIEARCQNLALNQHLCHQGPFRVRLGL